MYDELVKRLREADEKSMCGECGLNLHTGATKKGVLFAEAADAIEELSRLNAEITRRELKLRMEKPRWIPVEERLPELHNAEYLDEVTGELIRYKESEPIMIWLEKGGFMDIGIYEKSDAIDDFCYQGVPATVTHWMPLPSTEGLNEA
jgi:hypothetical protein